MGLNTPQQHTCRNNHNKLLYNLLNNYTVQKVKANNGHNKQETNYNYTSLQLNKRLYSVGYTRQGHSPATGKAPSRRQQENKTDWLSHG